MLEYTFSLTGFEILILILVRVSCFVSVAPFFGQSSVPRQVKIGLSVFISLLLYGFIDKTALSYTGLFGYAVIVLKEGITGLLIGLGANICNSIILFAGHIISMDIGLSMATEFNPEMNTQSTLVGDLYNYFIMLLLIATNMYQVILRAFTDSFIVVPVNGQVFDWDHLLQSMMQYMTDLFVIGFRIVLPIFACIMILNCILGILAKVSPQMNMFAVGMQMKIMVGFLVLFVTISLLPGIADFIFKEMRKMMVLFIEGMY